VSLGSRAIKVDGQKLAQPLAITMPVNDWREIVANLRKLLTNRSRHDVATEIRNQDEPVDHE
jgi:hypothetical protein